MKLKVYWKDFLWVLFLYEDEEDEKSEHQPSKKGTLK